MKKFAKKFPTVVINRKSFQDRSVEKAFKKIGPELAKVFKAGGSPTPSLFMVSSDATEFYGEVEMPRDDPGSAVRTARRLVKKKRAEAKEIRELDTDSRDEESFDKWANAKGKTIKAVALALKGDQVSFRLTNGKEVNYPLASLSPESRQRIKDKFSGEE